MTTVISSEQKAHVISSDAEAIAKELATEFVTGDSERDQQRRLPYQEVKKFSASGLQHIFDNFAKILEGAFLK